VMGSSVATIWFSSSHRWRAIVAEEEEVEVESMAKNPNPKIPLNCDSDCDSESDKREEERRGEERRGEERTRSREKKGDKWAFSGCLATAALKIERRLAIKAHTKLLQIQIFIHSFIP
jgi:hypothetical protein